MAIYDNLPYTNFHELNADWLLKTVGEMKDKTDAIDAAVERAEESEENAKTSELNAKASEDNAKASELSAKGYDDHIYRYTENLRDQVNANTVELSVHEAEIARIVSGTTPDANAELIDIRVAANGLTYPSAGDAVRNQFTTVFDIDPSHNLLNPANITEGKFYKVVDDGTGHWVITTANNAQFNCAWIDVVRGTQYITAGISYLAYNADADGYAIGDANSATVSTPNAILDTTDTRPLYNNAGRTTTRVYFSWKPNSFPNMYICPGTTPQTYEPYSEDKYTLKTNVSLPSSQVVEEKYVVDINGGGDYTSFTACLRDLAGNTREKTIYVKAGTYDVFTEIGGQAYAESIVGQGYTWKDVSVVVPPHTKIIGIGEAVLQFTPTGAEIPRQAAELLSPLNVVYDCYVENITIDCDNCRYGIHDQPDSSTFETRHIYKNVVIKKAQTNSGMNAAFGCGTQKNQYMEFDGCFFTSPGRPFSFHNGGGSVDNTIIVIKDCVAIATGSNQYSLRFGNVNNTQVKIDVRVLNTYMNSPTLIRNETTGQERPNAFALTYVGSGNPTVDNQCATNIYTPVIYQI